MNEAAVEIKLIELRKAFEVVVAHVESITGGVVRLDYDYFWSVPVPGRFDPSTQPTELTIGQVSEVWASLDGERLGDSDQALAYMAVWIGEVMQAIGHTVVG